MNKIIPLCFLLALCSCTENQNTKKVNNPPVIDSLPATEVFVDTSQDEGWGADVRLSFINKTCTDTSIVYDVNSIYKNRNIGFILSVPVKGHLHLAFRSRGISSDRFIQFFKQLYLSKPDTLSRFNNETFVDCMYMGDYIDSLNQQAKGVYTSTHYCKLFFQGKNEDDYAELYLNINDEEHWIELREKDSEYRKTIIKLFTSH
ncbi:MAG: hypothetical protein JST86_15840 [Bacteroidetes bacterium]|nr:hypothetical protein [Bacteroidota bacterium]